MCGGTLKWPSVVGYVFELMVIVEGGEVDDGTGRDGDAEEAVEEYGRRTVADGRGSRRRGRVASCWSCRQLLQIHAAALLVGCIAPDSL